MAKFTHIGILKGNDARTPDGFCMLVKLRQTKLHWVTAHNVKFKKETGRGIGDWPMYSLDLKTIEPAFE